MNNDYQKAIKKGIDFLLGEQRLNGSFLCLVSTKMDDYAQAETVPAIVPTNIVLSSLIHIDGEMASGIKKKAAQFLLEEKSPYWSFNYWFRQSDWYTKEPYPDDTDDTFCALAALYEYQKELFDGEVMAKILTMLMSSEDAVGGPYDMWLVPADARKKWRHIDLVCNSNIAYFLSLQDVTLPNLTDYIEQKIDERGFEFPYNTIYPGIYFISRFYKGKKRSDLIDLLLASRDAEGKWENPLRTALAISSLLYLSGGQMSAQLEKSVAYLIKTQGQNGGWEPYSFYFQMRNEKKTLYAGAASMTTALCLEAIHNYEQAKNQRSQTRGSSVKHVKAEDARIQQKILQAVDGRISILADDLKAAARSMLAKMVASDRDGQIMLLPHLFRQSLNGVGKAIPDDLVIQLGAANLFGWLAYTIYDDFIDEEGDPRLLSVANVALRESWELFSSVLPGSWEFVEFIKIVFDTIDEANCWEVTHCRMPDKQAGFRIPDYGDLYQLAHKSLGHILGPIAILFALGFAKDSPEVSGTMQFFRHYIIARQLNDDAHDWEDDFSRGHVNAAMAMMLKESDQLLHQSVDDLRQWFWKKTVVTVCQEMLSHLQQAKSGLESVSIISRKDFFQGMMEHIERSTQKALTEREETMKFLETYSHVA